MQYSLGDIRNLVRIRLDDTTPQYLWSDNELNSYINITLQDACIRAGIIVQDNIALPFTQNKDLTWVATYALDPGVIDVKSVGIASQPSFRLLRTSMRRQEQYYQSRPPYAGGPFSYALDLTIGGTGDFIGQNVRAITFIGSPTKADIAYLDIKRMPLDLLSDDDIPEIDSMWVPDLVYGITGLAYMKRDSDTFDPKRSEKDMAEFTARYGERLSAVVLRERQTEVPLEMILGY